MKLLIRSAALLMVTIASLCAFGQNKNELGLTLHLERSPKVTTDIPPGAYRTTKGSPESIFGLSYERLFTRRSGVAVEVSFRKSRNELQIPVASGASSIEMLYQTVVENIISMPLLYRYHSSIVNLSAGPTVEYFTSARQPYPYAPSLDDYKTYFVEQELSFGVLAGVSKTIAATSKLAVEPGLYYNRVLSFERSYYGASLAVKYRF